MAKLTRYIPLADVPALLPPRKRGPVSLGTIERWARYGVAGGKLKSYFIGSQEVTTREDLDAFVKAVSAHKQARRAAPCRKVNDRC